MALVLADRVKETTTSTGTTAITLAGAATGYQTFLSAVGDANTTYYTIADQTGANWEVGIGTYTSAGNTLSRDTVLASSNSGALVTFTAGTKDVFVTYPAGRATYQGGTFSLVAGSNVTITGTWPNQTIAASSGGSATKTISNKTAAYTVVAGDLGTIINCTSGTFNVSLTAAASLGSGFTCTIWNTGTGAITIDPSGAETIDGVATLILRRGEGTDIVCNGTNWETSYKKTMRGYAENLSNTGTRPNATGSSSIAIGVGSRAEATNGACSFGLTAVATANSASAFGFQANATGVGSTSLGYTSIAASNFSLSIGQTSGGAGSQTATGAGATAIGGSYASGADSFAAAIANNTSTYGAQNLDDVAIGQSAKANGGYSFAAGRLTISSGTFAISLGTSSTASGEGAVAIGGRDLYGAKAIGLGSCAIGDGAKASQTGKYAFTAYSSLGGGDSQYGLIVLNAVTTTTTAVALTSDSAAAGTTNQLILASGQAMTFFGTIIAKQTASANMASYTITGSIVNNAGTVSISSISVNTIVDTIGLGAVPTFTADNTNKALAVTSGYKAATSIRWVANLQSVEVTYA